MAVGNHPNSKSWQRLYQAALFEHDREKLAYLVQAVETALVFRLRELPNVKENDNEYAAMKLAAKQLVKIREKNWPALKPSLIQT